MRLFLAAASLLLALPGTAWAADATIAMRELPLHGDRVLASPAPPARFNLVGLQWQGSGTVAFRARALGGRWGAWRPAGPEEEDAPDARNPEAMRTRAWRLGNPWWVGASDRLEYRVHGRVSRLRAFYVWSPAVRVAARAPASADSPQVVPRAFWGADESIRRAAPSFAPALRFAVVHHTAGRNGYSQAEAAAIVRGIQLYHVKGNGWNDIGYNFLVDRFGTVYEGRFGGIDRNVVGAHAQGFNTGSVGVALIGTYDTTGPPAAAEDALARLLAWRLDLAHVDPLATLSFLSGGNPRFTAGFPVFLRAVSGHRDTGFTACPGDTLYARLADIAGRVSAIGLPKLYEPDVSGGIGGLVRFQARLSGLLPWTVTVLDALGQEVARGDGIGPAVDWTWDATLLLPGGYRWRIDGAAVTPAVGTLGTAAGTTPTVPLAIRGAAVDPETISPNGDGDADGTTLTYTLSAAATVTVSAVDITGQPVLEVQPPTMREPGEHAVTFGASGLADGLYGLHVVARSGDGAEVATTVQVFVTRTLGFVTAAPKVFSPNGDGRNDTFALRFRLAGQADVRVRVLRDGKWVATAFAGTMPSGQRLIRWDGSKRVGRLLDGSYAVVVEATDGIGTQAIEVPFLADTKRPVVRFLPGRPLRVWVSEPALLTLRVNGRPLRLQAKAPGVEAVPGFRRIGLARAVAWDPAGNVSVPVRRS